MITIEQARAAKSKLKKMLPPIGCSIGISQIGPNYSVQVGLPVNYRGNDDLPKSLDGVDIHYAYTGPVNPL